MSGVWSGGAPNHALNFNFTSHLSNTLPLKGGSDLACAEGGALMACAAYDLAYTWPRAGCTACSMCEGTILGLEATARYRPENPYQPARRQVGLEASSAIRHPI